MATSSIGAVVKLDAEMATKISESMGKPTKWVKCEKSHIDSEPDLSNLKNFTAKRK